MIWGLNYIIGSFLGIVAEIILFLNSQLKNRASFVINEIANNGYLEKELPQNLIFPLLEIEDKRYYSHLGIDIYSIGRAIFRNFISNRIQGASTITQQLIRGITDDRKIHIKRKLNEILLALLINQRFSKEEILKAYVHSYQFGWYKGVGEFCESIKYDISHLSLEQSIQIAARFKYPSLSASNYIKYLKRVRIIEIKMVNYGTPYSKRSNKKIKYLNKSLSRNNIAVSLK